MKWWHKFADTTSVRDAEEKRQRLSFFAISYIGGMFMLLFSLQHTESDNQLLRYILFSGTVVVFANVALSHFFPRSKAFYYFGGCLVLVLVMALVYSGGYQNTALYWVFPFYVVVFAVVGFRFGVYLSASLVLVIGLMLYNQELIPAAYPMAQVTRFLAALVATICIILISEFFWHQSHSELSSENLEKQRLANTDVLTNLPNRRFVDSVFLDRAISNPGDYFPLTMVMMDVDYFKSVNDTYGHDVGDKVLVHLAKVMKDNVRASDVVARVGGEEFLVLFPRTSLTIGLKLAEGLRQKIQCSPLMHEQDMLTITASMGVASALSDTGVNGAMKLADEHLYQAKEQGRNRVL